MARPFTAFAHALRQPALSAIAAAAIALPALSTPTFARGPENIADVAEKVIDAVVNISTSQKVEARGGGSGPQAVPQLPPGSPFEEFFEEFFKNRRGPGGDDQAPNRSPRRVNSLGSGFIVDAAGVVITNNHVIADADEITVILTDGTRLKVLIGSIQSFSSNGYRANKITGLGKLDLTRYDPMPAKHPLVSAKPIKGEIGIEIQTPSQK